MLRASQILVRTIALAASMAAVAGCGQRGPLFLPTEPAAAQRATLPQTLTPFVQRQQAAQPPAASPAPAAPPATPDAPSSATPLVPASPDSPASAASPASPSKP
ncbi:lipoprotein [Acidovorax sp. Leaf160]|uniref:LPS translocon maturation chaperone LptM n=1 Tax=Acidovorax sp. Leaf160 TaxID=1736280 RepID=UPI0009E9DD99|nr:lipoprotein [Acidovorax sp. Leaf160]